MANKGDLSRVLLLLWWEIMLAPKMTYRNESLGLNTNNTREIFDLLKSIQL